jgi:hypothetical protein
MEPILATTGWSSYTPVSAELLQVGRGVYSVVQVVQGTLSENIGTDGRRLVDRQGTFLTAEKMDSMVVVAGTVVNMRVVQGPPVYVGRNPQ